MKEDAKKDRLSFNNKVPNKNNKKKINNLKKKKLNKIFQTHNSNNNKFAQWMKRLT